MNTLQSINEWVWAPDSIEGYVKGVITDIKYDGLDIKVDSLKTIHADFDQVFPIEESKSDVDDNCSLMYLNSANLLNNLKKRYNRNCIYTYVANILIAVNPYKDIPTMYSKRTIEEYRGKSIGMLPPHLYAIADQSYRNLNMEQRSQAIIVSGESGAGKTETTKYILQYLTECYGSQSGPIEKRIVEANPLLEAFGNAKTTRNNNSSRSGKFVEVHFDNKSQITGAHLSHYLLEKSRVCKQSSNERNYHIFYRMCAGMNEADCVKLGLQKPDKYNYLRHGTTRYFCTKSDASKISKNVLSDDFLKHGNLNDCLLNDAADFQRTHSAMKDMGISQEDCDEIFGIVAGILHMGNIEFEECTSSSQGGCEVAQTAESLSALNYASQLLGFDKNSLANSLCNKYTQAAQRSAQNSELRIALRISDAQNARDALSKAIYVQLFEQIITFVNHALPFNSSKNFIGILDISGFEYFEKNNFEQFCINYCNEKMQQFFNRRILKDEQTLYDKEGLGLSKINFVDNQDCIDLIEGKSIGIIDILDEESRLPKPQAENFTTNLFLKNPKHFRLQLPRKSKLKLHREVRDNEGFLIRHYAGAVCYHTSEFIEKNNDALHDSLRLLLQTSTVKLMKTMFSKKILEESIPSLVITTAKKPVTGKLTFVSVGSKFRSQLTVLMDKLQNSGSNFIRCVKPNSSMVSNLWEGGLIISQLECGGMISVLDLMQQGYPSRVRFKDLYDIYQNILPSELARLDPKLFCKLMFKVVGLNDKDYRFGMTKVFFRSGKMAEFDKLIKSDPEHVKEMIKSVKTWLIKYRWRKAQYGVWEVIKLKNKISWRREQITKIQKTMRMWIMKKKLGPKIIGLKHLRQLDNLILQMVEISNHLKKGKTNAVQMVESNRKMFNQVETKIKQLPTKDNKNIIKIVENFRVELENTIINMKKEVELEKELEEKERLRKIQEAMELEKKKAEEERKRLEHEENEKRIKAEMETKRLLEEERQKKLEENENMRQKREMDNYIEDLSKEQERRDRELAVRLSLGDISAVEDTSHFGGQLKSKAVVSQPKPENVTELEYDELRKIINNSNDVKLLEACQIEFHRRINAYTAWKAKQNAKISVPHKQEAVGPTKAPNTPYKVLPHVSNNSAGAKVPQRFFKIVSHKNKREWLGHFDGDFIARQIEIFSENKILLLLAGVDDLAMCSLPLSGTGLLTKKGVEITEDEFEKVWYKYDGIDVIRAKQKLVTSRYVREKFFKGL